MNRFRNLAILSFLACLPMAYAMIGSESEVITANVYDSVNGYKIKGQAFIGSSTSALSFTAPTGEDLVLNTTTDSKIVKINSRDYTQASGSSIAFQAKPNQTVLTTGTVYGGQIQPRYASGIAGDSLVGLDVEPILKGTTGNLSGDWRGLDVVLESDNPSSRTIAGTATGIRVRNNIHTTVTGDVEVIQVTDDGGTTPYELLGTFPAVAGVFVAPGNTSAIANAGYLKIKIGGTAYRLVVMEDE